METTNRLPRFTREEIASLSALVWAKDDFPHKKQLAEKLDEYKRALKPLDGLKIIWEHLGYQTLIAHIPYGLFPEGGLTEIANDLKSRRVYALLNCASEDITWSQEKAAYDNYATIKFSSKSRALKATEKEVKEATLEELKTLMDQLNAKIASLTASKKGK